MEEHFYVTTLRQIAFDYYSKYYEALGMTHPDRFDPSVSDEVSGYRVTQTLAILSNFFNSFDVNEARNSGEKDVALMMELFAQGFKAAYLADLALYEKGLGDSDFNGIC